MNEEIKSEAVFTVWNPNGTWNEISFPIEVETEWLDNGLTRDEDWEIPSFMRKTE